MGHQVEIEELNELHEVTIAASHGEEESKKLDMVTIPAPKKIFFRVSNKNKKEVTTVQTLREAIELYNAI